MAPLIPLFQLCRNVGLCNLQGEKGSQSDSWLKALMVIHGLQVEAGLFARGRDLEGPSDWKIKGAEGYMLA